LIACHENLQILQTLPFWVFFNKIKKGCGVRILHSLEIKLF